MLRDRLVVLKDCFVENDIGDVIDYLCRDGSLMYV